MESTPTLVRARVQQALHDAATHPLSLVVAPAGSGKSTALRHLARDHPGRTVWCCPDPTAGPGGLLADLAGALTGHLGELRWMDVESAAADLQRQATRRPLVVMIDDFHLVCGSAGEQQLEDLVVRLPPSVRIVVASRRGPQLDMARLRISGHAVQVGEDVLRWRPWEVEELFRDVYGRRLRPEDAAKVCHRTEGWSAGLHLFHLATDWLDPGARTRLLTDMQAPPDLVRDYLTRNVIDGLEPSLRDFLVDTCVLGRLEPVLCDRLRGSDDSAAHLAELTARGLFVVAREDGRGLRYHEVLRSYLEASLLERDGPVEVRLRHGRAGRLLEDAGAAADAVHAYVRAEDWTASDRVLQRNAGALTGRDRRTLLDRLPPAVVRADPWLQLTRARVLIGEGRFRRAKGAYDAALAAFGRHPTGDRVRRERRLLDVWLEPRVHPLRAVPNRSELLRIGLRAEPLRVADACSGDEASDLLVAAALSLLAGSVGETRRLLDLAETTAGVDVLHLMVGRGLRVVCGLITGQGLDVVEVRHLADRFTDLGLSWAARLCRVAALEVDTFEGDVDGEVTRGVGWLPALESLLAGLGRLATGADDHEGLEDAADRLDRLGALVLGAWARSWAAFSRARAGDPQAELAARQALRDAHALVLPGPQAIAEAVLGACAVPDAHEHRRRAEVVAADLGLDLPSLSTTRVVRVVERRPPATRVRCFGAFDVCLDGRRVDLDALRPQARQVLAMVAVRLPQPVHRERLAAELWPDDPYDTQARRLGVLVSTLRRHLEPEAEAGAWDVLVRVGEAYVLRLPEAGYVDVAAFDDAMCGARWAGRRDPMVRRRFLLAALEAYDGDLLPEFGPAGWVVGLRDHYRHAHTDVATELAESELRRGRTTEAVETARVGLRVDRHSDRLWEVLVGAHLERGDRAAATRAHRDHLGMLHELGVDPQPSPPRDAGRGVTRSRGTRAQ